MSRNSKIALVVGGGVLLGGGALLAWRRSTKTTDDVQKALQGVADINTPPSERGLVKLRLTGYWPFTAADSEKKMEGKPEDATGAPLHTVEDFLAGKADYVSLAGDLQGHKGTVWPYGQKILIPWEGKTIVGRVVDTGGHFHGAGKLYRMVGAEPIDVCVYSSSTKVPTSVMARIVPGDNFVKGKAVATADLKNQTVVVGEGRTLGDIEALARAVESELGSRPVEEQHAAAWAMRNRADMMGTTLSRMLAPRGEYGPARESRGYASTRRPPSAASTDLVVGVLDAPSHADPTGGATEFWVPRLQEQMHRLGRLHAAAQATGDEERAARYARFAGYETEDDVRARYADDGLGVVQIIGSVELLRRRA